MRADSRAGEGKTYDALAPGRGMPSRTVVAFAEATITVPVPPTVTPDVIAVKVIGRESEPVGVTIQVKVVWAPGARTATVAGEDAPTVAGPSVVRLAVRPVIGVPPLLVTLSTIVAGCPRAAPVR